MSFRRRGYRARKNIKTLYLWLLFLLVVVLVLYFVLNTQLLPVIKVLASNNAKVAAVTAINNSIGKVLAADDINYDSLMSFDEDSTGKILAIKTNSQEINKLKYDVTKEILAELNDIHSDQLNIPLGNILGGVFLVNRGPNIKVTISPVGNVNTDFTSVFTSAGINQTHQQVMLHISVNIIVVISSVYTVTQNISNSMCIAETIIVGNVPNSYTNLQDGSDATKNNAVLYGNRQ